MVCLVTREVGGRGLGHAWLGQQRAAVLGAHAARQAEARVHGRHSSRAWEAPTDATRMRPWWVRCSVTLAGVMAPALVVGGTWGHA